MKLPSFNYALWRRVFNRILFWISNIALLFLSLSFALSITGVLQEGGVADIVFDIFPLSPSDRFYPERWFAFVPALLLCASLATGVYRYKKHAENERLHALFFGVTLPLLLICLGKIFLLGYPAVFGYVSVLILGVGVWLWAELLELQNHLPWLTAYRVVPLLLGLALSGWMFALWSPIGGVILIEAPKHIEWSWVWDSLWRLRWSELYVIPLFISISWIFLSPLFSFGVFVYETYKQRFSQKFIGIVAACVLVFGGAFALDILEKNGARNELYHTAETLGLLTESDDIELTYEQVRWISNKDRLDDSAQRVYLANLRYPLSRLDEDHRTFSEEMVYDMYRNTCFPRDVPSVHSWGDQPYMKRRSKPRVRCQMAAQLYELFLFPFYYPGDFADDRKLAERVYAYVFDASLQDASAQEMASLKNSSILGSVLWEQGRRRQTLKAGVIDENSGRVHLEEATHDVDYNDEIGVYTNTVTYTFHNQTRQPQEVFLTFNLPNTQSVITDLRLGMDLQLRSQVAPRGAAQKIYEQSLRRVIDPALLEQVGPRQYQLRVFPIPGDRPDASWNPSDGRQKVQFEFTSFVLGNELLVAPQIYTRNLGITKDTNIRYHVRAQDRQVLAQGSIPRVHMESGFTHVVTPTPVPQGGIPVGEDAQVELVVKPVRITQSDPLQVYVNVSASVNEKQMKSVVRHLHTLLPNAVLHPFNFKVHAPVSSAGDLVFWGPTDTQALVRELLQTREVTGGNVLILTDDSAFEITAGEATDLPYAAAAEMNQAVSVWVLGDMVPSMKHELTKLVATATTSNVQTVKPTKLSVQEAIMERQYVGWQQGPRGDDLPEERAFSPKWREAIEDLWAYEQGLRAVGRITNESTWKQAAEQQTEIAAKAHIVNAYNSLIALENDWQQEQLDKAKQEEDRYKSDHEMGEVPDGVIFVRSQSGPEAQVLMVLVLLGIMSTLLYMRKSNVVMPPKA